MDESESKGASFQLQVMGLMYRMVTMVKNTVLYIWKFLREQILKVLITGEKKL